MDNLIIGGIYSLKGEDNKYFIILEKLKNDFYYLYNVDCLNEHANNEIQEQLVNAISNNIIHPYSFLDLDQECIGNLVDGYLGLCSDEICEKLKSMFLI